MSLFNSVTVFWQNHGQDLSMGQLRCALASNHISAYRCFNVCAQTIDRTKSSYNCL